MEIERGDQRTIENIPTSVRASCPECERKHTFELQEKGLIPEGLQRDGTPSNDAAPLYEAECPRAEYGIVQAADIIWDADWEETN